MDYLAREDAPLEDSIWEEIDTAVVDTAKHNLIGRRFLPVEIQGIGTQFVKVDNFDKEEVFKDGFVKTKNRSIYEIPQLYADFWLNWRDIAASNKEGFKIDLSQAMSAAEMISRREDNMIFYGNKELGLDGLLTVKGSETIKLSDWGTGENAFLDVAKGVSILEKNNRYGNHTLIVSSDLYVALQRIQQGTGEIESERIKKLLDHHIIKSTVLEDNTAILVSAQKQYLDLVIGQDIESSYLEAVDLNHHFRILETILLRIKAPNAIVVFRK